jgi:hypothetical protein
MCYDKVNLIYRLCPGIDTSQLLGDHVSTVVFSCTANEARSYGKFVALSRTQVTHLSS